MDIDVVDGRLRGQGQRLRRGERAGQPGEHGQVGVELDALTAADPQRQQAPLVLEAAVLPLDRPRWR